MADEEHYEEQIENLLQDITDRVSGSAGPTKEEIVETLRRIQMKIIEGCPQFESTGIPCEDCQRDKHLLLFVEYGWILAYCGPEVLRQHVLSDV